MFIEPMVIGDLLEKLSTVCFAAYLLTSLKGVDKYTGREQSWRYIAIISVIFGILYAFGYYAGSGTVTDFLSIKKIGPNMAGLIAGPFAGVGAAAFGLLLQGTGTGGIPIDTLLTELMNGFVCGIVFLLNGRRLIKVWYAVLLGAVLTTADSIITLFFYQGIDLSRLLLFNIASIEILVIATGMGLFTLLMHNVAREREISGTASRLEGQVLAAREIQKGYLPSSIPAMKGIRVAAKLIPMHEVGGDFYDFQQITPTRCFFCIGDVAGKGVSAAFVMASSLTLLRNALIYSHRPAEILSQVNQGLIRSSNDSLFVTLLVGIMDIETGLITYANAGHNPPFLISENTTALIPMEPDIPVGTFDDYQYQQKEFTLKSGEQLVLYTDGVTECENKTGMLGVEPVIRALTGLRASDPDTTAQTITELVFTYAGSGIPGDDVTVLVIGRDQDP
ncbi:MAG TPA: SpoIIE family protein phosphatase [Methanospirillum sp.]|uniref:PP2C family protein-serine/threonine phosphatase n=1 Tax=Methanospirillum sp. TaxID=45200 RepID=UPI002CD0FEF5|nr:SpoIIE family protein phosphatase [Methanospirillum sp.]HWQ63052.1 SpoIIE family protein phosphatase [Methanospirillum sp.]